MGTIRKYDGRILIRDGKLAAAQACCCGGSSGACCLPGGCLFQSGAIWSGDEPETIPGYTKIPGGWQRLYVDGDCVALNENSQMNQDWFDAVWGVDPDAIPISGNWGQVAPSCEAAESQLACEGQGGTFYAGQTCEDNPCGCCCGVDGSAQSQSSVECEAAGSTFIEGSCDLECVSAGSGQPYPDCVNQFVVNCSNACSRVPDNDSNHAQCTCATVNSISEFNDCVNGFAAALQQQGWDAISYDSFTSSGTPCAIVWSRDIIACCSGEIDYGNAILAEDPFSAGLIEPSTPCPCAVIDGGYEDVDGVYVYRCDNAFP